MDSAVNGSRQPLQGLLVIDLTRLLPGPLCTMMLGDYGAEVIKIEDIDAGDPTRFVGPSFEGSGSFFRQLNRNKKSVAINLKQDQGRDVILKLVSRADILVEGFRPGVMERLGLGYKDLEAINPKLVYTSISGYGQQGPYRERAGHDLNYTALTGLLDLSAGEESGPVMPAVQIADIAGGSLMAVSGIMIALYQREITGKGSFVDTAMARGLLPWLTYAATAVDGDELPRRGRGYISGAYACYNIYETADGKYMSLGALEPAFWRCFCETVGRVEWTTLQFDEAGQKELIRKVKTLFKNKKRSEWEALFADRDACCEPVLDLHEAIDHPISKSGNYWLKNRTADGATEIMTGFPLLFAGQPGELLLPPPRHGEHTEEILAALGYDSSSRSNLAAGGIIKLHKD